MSHSIRQDSFGSLFKTVPAALPEELVDILVRSAGVRIERIVSRGHASPPDFWYDQPQAEFVLLVSGRARLAFAERDRPALELNPGDWVVLQARQRHRLDWTDPDQETVWLAVHFDGSVDTVCCLWRQDDNGGRFLVGTFPDRAAAEARRAKLESGGHRQIYWITERRDGAATEEREERDV